MGNIKLRDAGYSIKYGLEVGVAPNSQYRKFRRELKCWDSLIIEINRYLAGCIEFDDISTELASLISQCTSPQVRYFDKHGAFRLLGWLLDTRLQVRLEYERYCNYLNDKQYKEDPDVPKTSRRVRPVYKVLREGGIDKRCYPAASLEFE